MPSVLENSVRHQRTKFVKLCLMAKVDCKPICEALGMSTAFFTVLQACLLCISGKDEKANRLCRGIVSELNDVEREDSVYEISSAVQAFVQDFVALCGCVYGKSRQAKEKYNASHIAKIERLSRIKMFLTEFL